MDGEIIREERRTGADLVKTLNILFSFDGNDEMDRVQGYGEGILSRMGEP
jgi:hypothetical protein